MGIRAERKGKNYIFSLRKGKKFTKKIFFLIFFKKEIKNACVYF